jgi:hypothetical protein|tara:strand:- start:11249 stop:11497 length:249 start_codon:yes stop_codon:yes gene_type:complete
MKWYDWLTIFSLFIIVVALVIGTLSYYKEVVNECTSEPLVYGAKQMEELYGYKFIGTGYLITPINKELPLFVFNSNNITRQQ